MIGHGGGCVGLGIWFAPLPHALNLGKRVIGFSAGRNLSACLVQPSHLTEEETSVLSG